MQDFRNFRFWGKVHKLVLEFYPKIKNFPKDELFSLTSQLKRAILSIPTYIAEVFGKETELYYNRFLVIAIESASEEGFLLLQSKDTNSILIEKCTIFNEKIVEIKKMISTYLKKIYNNL